MKGTQRIIKIFMLTVFLLIITPSVMAGIGNFFSPDPPPGQAPGYVCTPAGCQMLGNMTMNDFEIGNGHIFNVTITDAIFDNVTFVNTIQLNATDIDNEYWVDTAGDTMSGNLNMSGNNIIQIGVITADDWNNVSIITSQIRDYFQWAFDEDDFINDSGTIRLNFTTLNQTFINVNQYPDLDTNASDDFSGSWDDLSDIPGSIADGDDDTTYTNGTGLSLIGTIFSIQYDYFANLFVPWTQFSWNNISDIPADIADGDNDTHAAGDGIYLYNDSDTMYLNETKLTEAVGDVACGNGTNVACTNKTNVFTADQEIDSDYRLYFNNESSFFFYNITNGTLQLWVNGELQQDWGASTTIYQEATFLDDIFGDGSTLLNVCLPNGTTVQGQPCNATQVFVTDEIWINNINGNATFNESKFNASVTQLINNQSFDGYFVNLNFENTTGFNDFVDNDTDYCRDGECGPLNITGDIYQDGNYYLNGSMWLTALNATLIDVINLSAEYIEAIELVADTINATNMTVQNLVVSILFADEFYTNGTVDGLCMSNGTGCNESLFAQRAGASPYLYNDSTTIYLNETFLNETINAITGSVNWSDILNIPADIADGDNDTTYENVSEFVNDAGYLTTVNWSDVSNIPADIVDGDNDTTYENVSEFNNDVGFLTSYSESDPLFTAWNYSYSSLIGVPTDLANFTNSPGYLTTVNWSDVSNIPADIADGDDDALGDLNCGNLEVIMYNATAASWQCIPKLSFTDTTLNESQVDAFVSNNGYIINETDPVFIAWNYNYSDLNGVPTDLANFTNGPGYLTTVNWSDVSNIPADIADGDNDTTYENVSEFVNDVGYLTTVNWSDVSNIPADIADGDNDTTYENVSEFVNDAGYLTTVNWSDVSNIPVDIADGDNDTTYENVSEFVNDAGYLTTVNWSDVSNIPVDIADGDNDTTYENLSEFVNDAGFLTSYSETDPLFTAWNYSYSSLIGVPTDLANFTNGPGYLTTVNWSDVSNIPSDIADGDNDTTYENVSEFANDAGYLTTVNWSDVSNIPADIADGDNDSKWDTSQEQYLYNDSTYIYFNQSLMNDTIIQLTGIFEEIINITVTGGVGTGVTVDCCTGAVEILDVRVTPTSAGTKYKFSANSSITGEVIDTDRKRHTGVWWVAHKGTVIIDENINYYITNSDTDEVFSVRVRYQR